MTTVGISPRIPPPSMLSTVMRSPNFGGGSRGTGSDSGCCGGGGGGCGGGNVAFNTAADAAAAAATVHACLPLATLKNSMLPVRAV